PDPLARLLGRDHRAESDELRRSLLVPIKLNVARMPAGLSFCWTDVAVASQPETVPALVLEGETRCTADEVFQQARRERAGEDDGESRVEQGVRFCGETRSSG